MTGIHARTSTSFRAWPRHAQARVFLRPLFDEQHRPAGGLTVLPAEFLDEFWARSPAISGMGFGAIAALGVILGAVYMLPWSRG